MGICWDGSIWDWVGSCWDGSIWDWVGSCWDGSIWDWVGSCWDGSIWDWVGSCWDGSIWDWVWDLNNCDGSWDPTTGKSFGISRGRIKSSVNSCHKGWGVNPRKNRPVTTGVWVVESSAWGAAIGCCVDLDGIGWGSPTLGSTSCLMKGVGTYPFGNWYVRSDVVPVLGPYDTGGIVWEIPRTLSPSICFVSTTWHLRLLNASFTIGFLRSPSTSSKRFTASLRCLYMIPSFQLQIAFAFVNWVGVNLVSPFRIMTIGKRKKA